MTCSRHVQPIVGAVAEDADLDAACGWPAFTFSGKTQPQENLHKTYPQRGLYQKINNSTVLFYIVYTFPRTRTGAI